MLGNLDFRRIPAQFVAALVEGFHLLAELVLGDRHVVPDIGVADGDAHEDLLAGAPDQDRRTPGRLGLAERVLHLEMFALEGRGLLRPHALQDLDALVEAPHARSQGREGVAVGFEFGLEPAGPESHDHPTPRDMVDGGDLLGQHGGIAEEGRGDEGAELQVFGDRGDCGEQGPPLQDRDSGVWHAVNVVAHPGGIEAEAVEFHGTIPGFGPIAFDLGQGDAEVQGMGHGGSPRDWIVGLGGDPPRRARGRPQSIAEIVRAGKGAAAPGRGLFRYPRSPFVLASCSGMGPQAFGASIDPKRRRNAQPCPNSTTSRSLNTGSPAPLFES